MNELAESLWNNVVINLDSFFVAITSLHLNLEKKDKDKIAELIDIGGKLIGF